MSYPSHRTSTMPSKKYSSDLFSYVNNSFEVPIPAWWAPIVGRVLGQVNIGVVLWYVGTTWSLTVVEIGFIPHLCLHILKVIVFFLVSLHRYVLDILLQTFHWYALTLVMHYPCSTCVHLQCMVGKKHKSIMEVTPGCILSITLYALATHEYNCDATVPAY